MTQQWTKYLRFCLLLGVTTAFPMTPKNAGAATLASGGGRSMTPATSSTALQLSFPTIPSFGFSVAAQKPQQIPSTKAKGLWYRDRSAAEEQLTTHSLPPIQATTQAVETAQPETPVQLPIKDWNPFGKVNPSMVQATCLSHAKLLVVGSTLLSMAMMAASQGSLDPTALHWNGGDASFYSLMDFTMTPWRVVEGVLATVPLVALSTAIGESAHSELCPVHISVTNTVVSLFGRREKEDEVGTNVPTVLLLSLGIAVVSALSEELVFRGLLPTVLESYTHSVTLALIGQALLFGMGQIRRKSTMAENGVFSSMQLANGLWYGSIYLGTGGDMLPVLIAHVLYECHVFVGAWMMVNDQLDYTEHECSSDKVAALCAKEQHELDIIREDAGGRVEQDTLAGCRRFFYAFDHEHRGSLCLADVKRAVAYAFLQDAAPPSDSRTSAVFEEILQERLAEPEPEEKDRITLSEFLRLLFELKSKKWNHQPQPQQQLLQGQQQLWA